MQSIIVYRNPAEAAFWEMMSNGDLFPVIVGVVVFFAMFLTLHSLVVDRWFRRSKYATNVSLFVSALCGFATIWFMAL